MESIENTEKEYTEMLIIVYDELKILWNEIERLQKRIEKKENNGDNCAITQMLKKCYYVILEPYKKWETLPEEIKKTTLYNDINVLINKILFNLNFNCLSIFMEENIELNEKMTDFSKKSNELDSKLKNYEHSILTVMGIFLAIFSLIGINISFLAKIPEYFSGWQIIGLAALINIIIVMSISCLFILINFIIKK